MDIVKNESSKEQYDYMGMFLRFVNCVVAHTLFACLNSVRGMKSRHQEGHGKQLTIIDRNQPALQSSISMPEQHGLQKYRQGWMPLHRK